jgi:GntR family transcriptional regulator, transcriptional repressor for pyruvate dehydrogenase complex
MAKKTKIAIIPIEKNVQPGSKKGVAQSVVNRVLDLIRTGMLRAGDRLPSERNLIEILDISRPSLREALRALAILGVVDSRHGGGAYVTNLEARTLLAPLDFFLALSETNLTDTFDSRRLVELEIVRRAAVKATAEDIEDLSGMLVAHEKVLSDPVAFRMLDSRFHARLSAIAGNAILERIAYGLYNMGLDIRRRATQDLSLIRRSLGEHTTIVRSIEAHDPTKAVAAMSLHLDHIESSTRNVIEKDHSALEVSSSRHSAESVGAGRLGRRKSRKRSS